MRIDISVGKRQPFHNWPAYLSSLFANNEQGCWYDPSDMATLYQDSAGTTPVTALEQPVGKMLDKSGRGNHAIQATAAKRPTYSARVNLLTYSEDFSNAAWHKSNVTSPTASTLVGSAVASGLNYVQQIVTGGVIQVEAKPNGANFLGVCMDNTGIQIMFNLSLGTITFSGGSHTGTIVPAADGYYKCTVAYAAGNRVRLFPSLTDTGLANQAVTGDGISGLLVRKAQLETGSTATRYQRVNAATDYDSAGFKRYLKFDGVDDAMATTAIDFSGTDKMTVCVGLRKLVGAGFQDSVELGTGADSGFSLHAPTSAADDYGLYMTGAANNFARCGVFAKPITNVVTAILDRGGATAAAQVAGRVNGASVSFTGGGVATAGSFVNGPLYIGARAGTSLYFNGHLYGLLIRGAQSTNGDVINMEYAINNNTGAF